MDRTIIEVAVSGRGQTSDPAALADEMIACVSAGASIVHNHLSDFQLNGSAAAAANGEIWAPVRAAHPGVILYPTLVPPAPGDPLGRYGHVVEAARVHGALMAPLDPGSVNLAAGRPDGQPDPVRQVVYSNDYGTLDRVLTALAQAGIASSISIFDGSFLRAAMAYERAGRFAPGSFVKFYFGGPRSTIDVEPGLSFGLPPILAAVDVYLAMMEGSRLPWGVAVPGGDMLADEAFVAGVLERGGHLRVGREDNCAADSPSNLAQVERAASLAARYGRPAASPAEAAAILGLPTGA